MDEETETLTTPTVVNEAKVKIEEKMETTTTMIKAAAAMTKIHAAPTIHQDTDARIAEDAMLADAESR